MTAAELSQRLLEAALAQLVQLERLHLPGLELPRVFAGHRVTADTGAALAHALGALADAGVREVAGRELEASITRALAQIDGHALTESGARQVAECLLRDGPGLASGTRDELVHAVGSFSSATAGDLGLPIYPLALRARTAVARQRLGLDDGSAAEILIERLIDELARAGLRAPDAGGRARFDAHWADAALLAEPFAQRAGARWRDHASAIVALVERVAAANGAAVVWGRSTGVASLCLSIELCGLALAHELTEHGPRWLALAELALRTLCSWFQDGLVATARGRRDPDHGPARALHTSLEVIGKLADAAIALGRARAQMTLASDVASLRSPRHELVSLDGRAAAWSFRRGRLWFAVPLVDGALGTERPVPLSPGALEVPAGEACAMVPVVFQGGKRFAPGGAPLQVQLLEDGLVVTHPWIEIASAAGSAGQLAGQRTARFRVADRELQVEERLSLPDGVDAVALQINELPNRPLHVTFSSDAKHRVGTVEAAGVAEHRSAWSEPERIHQLELAPAAELRFTWSVAWKTRVAVTMLRHHYNRCLYGPLASTLAAVPANDGDWQFRAGQVDAFDVLHLHWPEFCFGRFAGLAEQKGIIGKLKAAGVPIVWTQHNLTPHDKRAEVDPTYQAWAEASDAAIHHSAWGREQMMSRYRFAPGTRHVVIPHGHFGDPRVPVPSRAEAEQRLGLSPCAIRIGLIGAPRVEKDTHGFSQAFARTRRRDIQLVHWSLGAEEEVVADERIRSERYRIVDRETYELRLSALDLIAMPFMDPGMLVTGTVADAVGRGIGVLASRWPFLSEYLGEAGIYFDDLERLVSVLESLDPAAVARAGSAAVALQDRYSWTRVAQQTAALLEDMAAQRLD